MQIGELVAIKRYRSNVVAHYGYEVSAIHGDMFAIACAKGTATVTYLGKLHSL